MRGHRLIVVAGSAALLLSPDLCEARETIVEVHLALDASRAWQPAEEEPAIEEREGRELNLDRAHLAFGEAGSWYWSVGGGVGFSGHSTDTMGQITIGTFLADSFEINFGARGWSFNQDGGQDAYGASIAAGFRWHFVQEETYSIYAHAGIGFLEATEDVPPSGTRFNFTPTVGVGTTFEIGESDTRLDLGLRWHHISNATISGSDDNPSRDGVMLYAAVVFPF